MAKHGRESFFVVGEGLLTPKTDIDSTALNEGATTLLSEADELRQFRFSRIGQPGAPLSTQLAAELAETMTGNAPDQDSVIPAGYTYLGQFVDHDLTMDKTVTVLGSDLTVDELIQGRSPSLDLDSLYGRGPAEQPELFSDGIHLKVGRTAVAGDLPELDGFDLPRDPSAPSAVIADPRNDENLAVAQTHCAFIRFHNRVVDTLASGPESTMFARARATVARHYQWMLRTDYLPRIVDPGIVEDVFTNGRKLFETSPPAGNAPTMPIEFSVAAFRLGHSMVRPAYDWNRIFDNGGGTLGFLFQFSGTSGSLKNGARLPSNWIADFRRLYNFAEAGRLDLAVPLGKFNFARRIDTRLTDPLKNLPPGSFGETGPVPPPQANLAFRNLIRGTMVKLASGQQMAALAGVAKLTDAQIVTGQGGVDFSGLAAALRTELTGATPLWLYILREAEFNNGQLTGVAGASWPRCSTERWRAASTRSSGIRAGVPASGPTRSPSGWSTCCCSPSRGALTFSTRSVTSQHRRSRS
jgi:hypothetical protein